MPKSSSPLSRRIAALLTAATLSTQLTAGIIIADRDAHIFGGTRPSSARTELPAQESNFGAARQLELKTTPGKGDGFTRKVYVGFDLATLPQLPATPGSVSLRLTVQNLSKGPAGDRELTEQPLVIYLLKKSADGDNWVEGQGNPNSPEHGPATGGIHWLNAPANYIQAGNQIAANDSVEAARVTIPADVKGGHTLVIPLSAAALTELTQRRAPDRATFVVVIKKDTDDLLRLHSRDVGQPAQRPALIW